MYELQKSILLIIIFFVVVSILFPYSAEEARGLLLEQRRRKAVDVNVGREKVVQLGAAVRPQRQLLSDAALFSRVLGDVGVPVLHRTLHPLVEELHGQLPVLENPHSAVRQQDFLGPKM